MWLFTHKYVDVCKIFVNKSVNLKTEPAVPSLLSARHFILLVQVAERIILSAVGGCTGMKIERS
jgi:hypothetical protein